MTHSIFFLRFSLCSPVSAPVPAAGLVSWHEYGISPLIGEIPFLMWSGPSLHANQNPDLEGKAPLSSLER